MADAAWFEAEVQKTEGDLRAFLAGLGAGRHLDEVMQDSYVALWQQGVPPGVQTLPWLKGVAKHKLVDVFRRQVPGSRQSELLETLATDADDDGQEDAQRRTSALRHCLGLLPGKLRAVVDAFYRDAKTSQAIAGTQGTSPVAVRKQLMQVRRRLLACVQQRLAAP